MCSGEHKDNARPADFLIENLNLLPRGRVLDVAMGEGRNSIYLARMGFRVEGVDISPDAIAQAQETAREAGFSIQVQVADLEKGYSIPREGYDVIICFNYLQRSLIPMIKDGIRKGGLVVYETFIIDQVRFGKPTNPNFLLKYNELLNFFRDFRCLRYREGIFEDRKAIASIVAEKV
jgi:tellurite methyltransferase